MVLKNYRLISLLPIFGKVFEKIMFNAIFERLECNQLFAGPQSGFIPCDSCIAQLISITQNISSLYL